MVCADLKPWQLDVMRDVLASSPTIGADNYWLYEADEQHVFSAISFNYVSDYADHYDGVSVFFSTPRYPHANPDLSLMSRAAWSQQYRLRKWAGDALDADLLDVRAQLGEYGPRDLPTFKATMGTTKAAHMLEGLRARGIRATLTRKGQSDYATITYRHTHALSF